MRRPVARESGQFEALFHATRIDLLAYIARRCESAEDAADVLAETYLIAWRKLDAIPAGEQARLWLFGVARNLLLRGASRRRTRHALVERLAAELRLAWSQQSPVEDERVAPLRAAVAALPEREREIVLLTAWEGLAPREIGVVLGVSANVVRVGLHRARTKLKRAVSADPPTTNVRSIMPACEPSIAKSPARPR